MRTPATPDHSNNRVGKTSDLCGLVLAGGEGQRLRPFVRRLRGDALPKQYVKFNGYHSMLDYTYRRVETLIGRERIFTVINQEHLNFPEVHEQVESRHSGTVIVQPVNRETGPGLFMPLTYLRKRYPGAIVAVFPSDQFILESERLMRHIQLAHAMVQQRPEKIVLLGAVPEYEESDYGYILPSKARDTSGWGIPSVSTFIEKPDILRAHELIAEGALWNTMLMVFRPRTLFHWLREIRPEVYQQFARIYAAIGTDAEAAVVRAVYAGLTTMNFSKELLEPLVERYPGKLSVLPVTHLTWSDWGTESRILSSLKKLGRAQPIASARPAQRRRRRGNPDQPAPFTM